MKRIRLFVVAALAAASLGVTAAPASASCPPEEGPCCPHDNPIDRLWVKLTGEHLFNCPWA
ncbi:MAG TPA: hypothetical protein VHI71_07220 [Actinomycetota bacterium]|nr:hypothetical protein [Actinomycetota bacterium]